MKHRRNYTIFDGEKIAAFAVLIVLVAIIFFVAGMCARGEEKLATVWAICKPGSQITVRRSPTKNSMDVGYLECGDSFLTDGESKNGYIRAYGIGEYGEAYVYAGFVSTVEPVPVFQRYVCVAKNRVACRRWLDGPKTENPWLRNGSNVQVFYIAGDWACTARGYIKSEWLEVDP